MVGTIGCKVSHYLSSFNPSIAQKTFGVTSMTLVNGQHGNFLWSLSDSEILTTLQTLDAVVRTQIHDLDADKFPMLLGR